MTASRNHVIVTKDFNRRLDLMSQTLRNFPTVPLLIELTCSYVEKPYSLAKFLKYNKVRNPLFLKYYSCKGGSRKSTRLHIVLDKKLKNVSTYGDKVFRPLSELIQYKECFSVGIGSEPKASCSSLGRAF